MRTYLWTDAFAVCNFLGLARATGERRFTELAVGLVERVHHALGRQRADAATRGWISGLGEAAGEASKSSRTDASGQSRRKQIASSCAERTMYAVTSSGASCRFVATARSTTMNETSALRALRARSGSSRA